LEMRSVDNIQRGEHGFRLPMERKPRTTNSAKTVIPIELIQSAREAGLSYVSDQNPGILRRKTSRGFDFIGVLGKRIRDSQVIARIRGLIIPPAWTDVWICPVAHGHLQAVGRDARGRKQYRYHPRYREARDRNKFDNMLGFGGTLPAIRKHICADLRTHGLPRKKVLAAVVRLLDLTSIRIGNEEYAKENDSFGLTTLRNGHVRIKGRTLQFHFQGKSGQEHHIEVKDLCLARIVRRCREIPGQELFEYLAEDGQPVKVRSEDVNEYLRAISGEDFTAKDFRTWSGTTITAGALEQMGAAASVSAAKRNIVAAIKSASEQLGNRPPACRKYYVHPAVLESYSAGHLMEFMKGCPESQSPHALRREEAAVMKLLEALPKNPVQQ
jgi:DNA topoisomerase I